MMCVYITLINHLTAEAEPLPRTHGIMSEVDFALFECLLLVVRLEREVAERQRQIETLKRQRSVR